MRLRGNPRHSNCQRALPQSVGATLKNEIQKAGPREAGNIPLRDQEKVGVVCQQELRSVAD